LHVFPQASLGFTSLSSGSDAGGAAAGGVVPMPPGFLEDFGARFADEGLAELLDPMGEHCRC
jgi:hypothetical protein